MSSKPKAVAWQSRFNGCAWRDCSREHYEMVMACPEEWLNYEVRTLYTAEALAALRAEVEALRSAMFKVYCVAANGGDLDSIHHAIEEMRTAMEKTA